MSLSPAVDQPSDREQRVLWDAFREEHSEAIDQLPLTIHRQYSLLRELDERTKAHLDQLQPLLTDYINHRLFHDPQSQSNRRLLTRIVRLSDNLVRDSEEKVNIALAVNNSVERHLRLLDHAIQEVQLSLGAHPGSNAASIHLPDLVVPRWSRASRTSPSPLDNFDDGGMDGLLTISTLEATNSPLEMASFGISPQLQTNRGRKSRGTGATTSNQTVQLTFRGVAAGPPFALTPEEFVVDSSERLYCYCQEVSFGEMIACDSPKCEREWFHLSCVGLEGPPKGKWFCEECSAKRKNKKK
ncbi:hypothetical protein APHAL10511_001364 [Amanita phalloides]|nr:hypothetical protein APHAL10511_001364 [Amanita phalloides]